MPLLLGTAGSYIIPQWPFQPLIEPARSGFGRAAIGVKRAACLRVVLALNICHRLLGMPCRGDVKSPEGIEKSGRAVYLAIRSELPQSLRDIGRII